MNTSKESQYSRMQPYEVLEDRLQEWSGMPYVVACSSGTAALHLALEALELPLGSEVIVPEFTMIACARAVVLAGHKPVFVDCGDDLLLDNYKIGDACASRKVKAIMPVHIYGRRCDMDTLHEISSAMGGLYVIEDLAEAHGVRPHEDTDAACWSFYQNKIVAGAEGGAVGFRNKQHADRARCLRSLGFTEAHDFVHVPRGHNYRLSNLHAREILRGRDGLDHFEDNLGQRWRAELWYDACCPDEWKMPKRAVCWVYDLQIPGMAWSQQTDLVRKLNEDGVAARHGFKPMSSQPEFIEKGLQGATKALRTNAYRLSQEVIYLPVAPEMEIGKVERAMSLTKKIAAELGL